MGAYNKYSALNLNMPQALTNILSVLVHFLTSFFIGFLLICIVRLTHIKKIICHETFSNICLILVDRLGGLCCSRP